MVQELKLENCINDRCPCSGEPVAPDSLLLYRGHVVGFCNPGCRDKFARALDHFEAAASAVDNRAPR